MQDDEDCNSVAALAAAGAVSELGNILALSAKGNKEDGHAHPLDDEECEVELQHGGEALVDIDGVGAGVVGELDRVNGGGHCDHCIGVIADSAVCGVVD